MAHTLAYRKIERDGLGGHNIELSRPADLRESARVQWLQGTPSTRQLRGRLQRFVRLMLESFKQWRALDKFSILLEKVPSSTL